jgi:hypothetical protein
MVIDIYHLILLKRGCYWGGAKIFGGFRVKNHDFTPKNDIFSNFRVGAPPPPWIRPCIKYINIVLLVKLRYGLLFNKQNYLYIDQQHGPTYMYCMPFLYL